MCIQRKTKIKQKQNKKHSNQYLTKNKFELSLLSPLFVYLFMNFSGWWGRIEGTQCFPVASSF